MLDALNRTLDRLSRGLLAVSNVLLVGLFLLINTEIAVRALFGTSTLISDEYSGYLFCWLTLTSLLFCMRTKALLRVEFAVGRLRGGSRALAEAFAALAGLLVAAITCYASSILTLTTWKFNALSSQYSQTPLYLPQLMMPAAFALLAVAYLAQLLTSLREFRRPAAPRESRDE